MSNQLTCLLLLLLFTYGVSIPRHPPEISFQEKHLSTKGGYDHILFKRHDIHQLNHKVNSNASRVKSKLLISNLKAFLSILCGLSIAVELGEELFENIPILKHFHRHIHLAHGVLLLTLSHLLHTLFELIDEIEKHSEIKEQRLKLEEVI